jgi:transcriptional regulator with XRE-family HTH domain
MDSDDTLSERVAEEIRAMLGRKRVTGREVARRLKVSSPWISQRLTGHTEISLNDLERIAAALDVEVAELLPTPVRRSGQRTTSDSSHQAERPTAERLMAAQIHPDHETHRPADAAPRPAEIRAGTRRPRIRSYTHGR